MPGNPEARQVLRSEVRGDVVILTLNRPEARNAFNAELSHALSDALDRFEEDPRLRVGILTGAGGIFSAGMDLKAMRKGEKSFTEKRGGFGILAHPPGKPLIAAVEGYAVAGGLELALSCDLIVAADPAPVRRLDRGGGLADAPQDGAQGPALEGRRGGCPRLRREAPTGLARGIVRPRLRAPVQRFALGEGPPLCRERVAPSPRSG